MCLHRKKGQYIQTLRFTLFIFVKLRNKVFSLFMKNLHRTIISAYADRGKRERNNLILCFIFDIVFLHDVISSVGLKMS